MTIFDVVKQLELDSFCDLMYGAVNAFGTQEGLKEAMQAEITEAELQRINAAALLEGQPSISFLAAHKSECPLSGIEGKERKEIEGDRVKELAVPIIEYLRDHCHPYVSVVITDDRVAVTETVLSIPEDQIS